jgi:hypothetical protein
MKSTWGYKFYRTGVVNLQLVANPGILSGHASRQTSEATAPNQIRRFDVQNTTRPTTAKRQKGEEESLAEETTLKRCRGWCADLD